MGGGVLSTVRRRRSRRGKDEGGETEATLTSAAFRSERVEGRPADPTSSPSRCDPTRSFRSSSVAFHFNVCVPGFKMMQMREVKGQTYKL